MIKCSETISATNIFGTTIKKKQFKKGDMFRQAAQIQLFSISDLSRKDFLQKSEWQKATWNPACSRQIQAKV